MLHRIGARQKCLAAALALATSCSGAKSGRWEFEFACRQLKQATARLTVSIASGSCSSKGAVVYERTLALSERGPAPGELAPGAYAFAGDALRADGQPIGTGCTEVVLPERRDIRVAIADRTGLCSDEDPENDAGAAPDAAADAATGDAADRDAETSAPVACVRFADASASAAGADGLSFATAWPDVQSAIDAAAQAQADGCEVWVRAGTYYIYRQAADDTLAMRAGVSLYGGFSGNEVSRADRDVAANPTVLSGLDQAGGTLHVLHVVTGADAVLDGFVISDGRAVPTTVTASGAIGTLSGAQAEDPAGFGGGMLNIGVSPEISNCIFRRNSAARCGGAIAASNSSSLVRDSVFEANESTGSGGAVCALNGAVEISRSKFASNLAGASNGTGGGALYAKAGELLVGDALFYDNASSDDGGAVLIESAANARFANCTLSANRADSRGGAFLNRDSVLELVNGIAWANVPDQLRKLGPTATSTIHYSDVMGGALGAGNLDLDPGFADAAQQDFRLTSASPCIDAALGTNASSRDLAGHPRNDAPGVANTGAGLPAYADLGAFEYQP